MWDDDDHTDLNDYAIACGINVVCVIGLVMLAAFYLQMRQ